jgi:cytochrome c556
MNRLLRKLFWVMVFMVVSLLLYGCDQLQGRMSSGDSIVISEQLSKEQLRSALDNYEEFFIATVKDVSNELDELMPDTRNYKSTLHLRDQTISACRTMLEQDDPQVAFVDSWVLAVRLAEYFKSGQGSDLFGKYQSLVVDAAGQIQEHIERIGKEILDAKTFIMTRDKVYEFVRKRPINKKYAESIVFSTKSEDGQPSPFESIVSLPLVPFKVVEGATRGMVGTNKLSDSADHFSDIVEGLPESARWQLLLLLYDMEKTDSVKSALASMNEFAQSSSRLADSAEKLPDQLKQELSALIQEIDNKQANLQATLEKTEKTAAAIERALSKASDVAGSIEQTGNSVNQAATAWEKAAIATKEVLSEVGNIGSPGKGTDAKPPFDINDYRDTAETVSQTVSKMQELTVEVHKLIESEQLQEYSSEPRKITNLLAWRIAQLVALIFLLALAYRFVTVRFINKPK